MVDFWMRYRRNRAAVFGLVVIVLIIIMALTASLFYPNDPFRLMGKPLSGPLTNGFLLGSDSLGRDVASGIVHGAKTSLLIQSNIFCRSTTDGGGFSGGGMTWACRFL